MTFGEAFRGAAAVGALAAALGLGTIGGCSPAKAQQAPPPPPPVTVSHPVQREVVEWDDYTGYLEAPETVNVQARVSGMIESAPFIEGSIVPKGTVLYQLDARPFKADLDSKEADIVRAEAQQEVAQADYNRVAEAAKTNAVSKQDLDNADAALKQAKAAVAQAKAAAEQSRLNLEWTTVTAPVTGRISFKQVTPGNLINGGAGQATLLTTITSIDPMYCYVTVDEASVLKYQQLAREKKRVSARDARIPCFMKLSNEPEFPHEGVVDFVDNHIDPNTGTLRARGVFPNPNGWLTPGSFARVRVPGSGRYTATLIPDAAIGTDQNQKFVLLVGPEDVVEPRTVTLGALFGNYRSIESGITPADLVIVNGMQKARPGAKVAPQLQEIPADAIPLTAPGSPATQELPATRNIPTTAPIGADANPAAAAAAANAAAADLNGPATKPDVAAADAAAATTQPAGQGVNR